MYSAKSSIDGKSYTADQFQQMTEVVRAQFKGNMLCEECDGKAFFVSKGKNGKQACFGAKHKDGCLLKTKSNHPNIPIDVNETNQLIAKDDEYKLDSKNYIVGMWRDNKEIDSGEENQRRNGESNRRFINMPKAEVVTKRTLPQILKICTDGSLSQHFYRIEIEPGLSEHIQRCVFNINKVSDSQISKVGFYWTEIHNASSSWLNSGNNYNEPSFLIGDEIQKQLWSSLVISPNDWDVPIPAIVKGKLSKSSKGKFYVEVTSLECIYIQKRKFKKAFKGKITRKV